MNNVFNKVLPAVFAALILFSVQLNAQSPGYDTTFRPKGYEERIAKFKKEPISKKDYVFLGNSITAGTNWSELLGLPNAVNRGISGDITFGVLDRLDEIIAGKPAKLFVLIGINDISRKIPDSLILGNYKKMISRVRKGSKKTQLYFYTLLPVNNAFAKFNNHYGKDAHILWLNQEIKKLADKKVTIIDLYPVFSDENKVLRAELTKDGLHLIPAGYKVWADFLKKGGYLK
jgi:lysophospholipase L1-like esterase